MQSTSRSANCKRKDLALDATRTKISATKTTQSGPMQLNLDPASANQTEGGEPKGIPPKPHPNRSKTTLKNTSTSGKPTRQWQLLYCTYLALTRAQQKEDTGTAPDLGLPGRELAGSERWGGRGKLST